MSERLYLWGSHTRVRLAEALQPAELDSLQGALDTDDGIAQVRAELDRIRKARTSAEQARARVRKACSSQSRRSLEKEFGERRTHVSLGGDDEAATFMEWWRIIQVMRVSRWDKYRPDQDPGA